jgi:hypothetical protein
MPQLCDPKVPAHLAVQYDHMLRVSTEPCLHGFADGAQFVQRRGMKLRPAEVLDLWKCQGATAGEAISKEMGGGTGYRGLEKG